MRHIDLSAANGLTAKQVLALSIAQWKILAAQPLSPAKCFFQLKQDAAYEALEARNIPGTVGSTSCILCDYARLVAEGKTVEEYLTAVDSMRETMQATGIATQTINDTATRCLFCPLGQAGLACSVDDSPYARVCKTLAANAGVHAASPATKAAAGLFVGTLEALAASTPETKA